MIIDGKAIASRRLEILRNKIQETKINPKLAIVMVTGDPATEIYVRLKCKAAAKVGIVTEVVDTIDKVSPDADGIIVQLPYPNQDEVIAKIPIDKDVDGLRESSPFLPATVKAILTVIENVIPAKAGIYLNRFRVEPGMTYVIVGQGKLVGKPLADYLEKQNYNVIRCDINTQNLKEKTLKGDVLVSATGVDGLITADMVKPAMPAGRQGAIVIDCGSPKAEVDFEKVKNIASAITPVPGGVGPLTVISLLENLIEAVKITE